MPEIEPAGEATASVLQWLGEERRQAIAASWVLRLLEQSDTSLGRIPGHLLDGLRDRVPSSVKRSLERSTLDALPGNAWKETLDTSTDRATTLLEAAWLGWPFVALRPAAIHPALDDLARALRDRPDLGRWLAHRQALLLGSPAGAVRARWRRSGELDSPVPPRRVREVADRPPEPLPKILARCGAAGSLVLVEDPSHPAMTATLLSVLDRGLPTFVADAAGRPWKDDLEILARDALRDELGWAPKDPADWLLLRPDLARSATSGTAPQLVEGLVLRRALERWLQKGALGRLGVTLGGTSFALRHAPPGVLVVRVDLGDIPDGRGIRRSSPWNDRFLHLFEDRTDGNAFARRLWSALSDLRLLEAGGLEACLDSASSRIALRWRDELVAILRRWILHPTAPIAGLEDRDLPPPAWCLHGQATAQLYRLLHHLDRLERRHPRRTLQGLPVDRWLSLLSATGYSHLALVLDSLAGEALPGVHLVQVPPLEHANLRRADLSSGDLYHANLAQADLREARLQGCDLSRAHLKGAVLREADLRDADLSYACLEQADLRGARLEGVDLHRANLDDALIDAGYAR